MSGGSLFIHSFLQQRIEDPLTLAAAQGTEDVAVSKNWRSECSWRSLPMWRLESVGKDINEPHRQCTLVAVTRAWSIYLTWVIDKNRIWPNPGSSEKAAWGGGAGPEDLRRNVHSMGGGGIHGEGWWVQRAQAGRDSGVFKRKEENTDGALRVK